MKPHRIITALCLVVFALAAIAAMPVNYVNKQASKTLQASENARVATKVSEPTNRSLKQKNKPKTTEKRKDKKKDSRKVHWSSIVAFLCGVIPLLEVILLWSISSIFLTIPAFVFGIIGMRKSGKDKPFKGKALAMTGFFIGLLGIASAVMLIIAFMQIS